MSSVPAGWTRKNLGDIARVYSGGTPSRSKPSYWGGEIPWASTAEIDSSVIRSTKESITQVGLENSSTKIAPAGTLLMAMYGQGKTRGKTSILGIPAAMNQACAAIEPSRDIEPTYLLAYLRENYDSIRSLSNSGGQENLSGEIVKKIPIILPSPSEQSEIAKIAVATSSLIDMLELLIAKKQAVKQGIMQQLLTGRTRLPGFVGEWSMRTLGELGAFLKGRGIKRDDVRQAGVPCIRYGELYTTYHSYTSETVSFVSRTVAATALPIQTGDLLFAGSGETRDEIGMSVAYTGASPAVAGGDIVVLRGTTFNAAYLACLVNTPLIASQKARLGQGDAVVHVSSRALSSVEVSLPPREEQDAIAAVVTDADDELAALRASLNKAKAVKRGMMQELLSGRTRLKVSEALV